jgi:hypothetical protein
MEGGKEKDRVKRKRNRERKSLGTGREGRRKGKD